jgi:hypothetical protein
MTQSHRASDKPSPAAPKGQAAPQESGRLLAPDSEPFSREELLAPFSREELLARYRRQRALPDDPFEQGGKPVPPPGYRERIMAHPRPASRFLEPEDPPAAPAPQRRSLSLGQTFAVAAAMALAAGAGVGMVNARLFSGAHVAPSADPAPVHASTPATVAPAAQTAQKTVVTKKAVSTATLQVSDAAGETNSFIPLALSAESAELGSDILLKISGIPEGAYLTSGRRDEDKIWALTLAELKDLRLVVPEAQDSKLDLAVAAFEPQTGELAAPVKTLTVALSDVVVQPASAPPPSQTASLTSGKTGQPAPIPPPDSMTMAALDPTEASAARALVLEGDSLLKSGDVRQARLSYEKAWAGGSPAGAYGMARSFDPVVLGSLALKNDKPDTAKALAWYERAAIAGHAGAADSIVRLRLKR